MIWSRVAGTGSYLPARRVSNADLARGMDTSDEWISTRTGVRQRYIADEAQAASDLALEASKAALASAGLNAEAIDLIIFATSTPDQILPSSACLLQEKLRIKGTAAFDVQAACSGFIYALSIADKFVRSGQNNCALVVGAEVFSRLLDWNDSTTAVLFGDGAGAVILQANDAPGVLGSALHADGSQAEMLSVPATVRGGKIVGAPFIQMDGPRVFKFAVRALEKVARDTVAQCGLQLSDVDWLIPHQANVRILEATASRLGIPRDRVVVTVDEHANTSAASVPIAFDCAVRDGRIQRGQTVLLEGVGSGFTWGALLLRY